MKPKTGLHKPLALTAELSVARSAYKAACCSSQRIGPPPAPDETYQSQAAEALQLRAATAIHAFPVHTRHMCLKARLC